jgi:hypothetical protein
MQLSQRPPQLPPAAEGPARFVLEAAGHAPKSSGRMTAVASAVALLFSAFSFWESSIKGPNIKVFVPPVIQYSSPYNNSNFEMIAVPVTLVNDGGRTGTVLSMELDVSNSKTKEPKHFYAADFGRWTMEKTRAGAYETFAPISLAGKASRTETVLFYPKSPAEKPDQLITEPGVYNFKLKLDEAPVNDWGPLDKLLGHTPAEISFTMELRFWDARSFQNGTIPMYSTTGRSTNSGDAPAK